MTIMLTEQDIPGAELPKPPENCTVAILKRWLSCRGAKVSGKRNELIKRSVLLSNNQANLEYTRRMAVQLKSTRIMVITIKFSNNCFALNLTVVTLLYQVPFQLTEKLLPLTVDFGMIFYQSWRTFTLIISFQNWFTQEFSIVKCDGIKYWNFPARCKDK